MTEFFERHHRNVGLAAVVVLAIVILVALQATLFYQRIGPRMQAANETLHALVVETAQRRLYAEAAAAADRLVAASPPQDDDAPTLSAAWQDFAGHFGAAPAESIAALRDELPGLTAGRDAAAVASLESALERLAALYANDFKALIDDLRRPPFYLWPTAGIVAARSGYRQAAVFNRALYLAQTGDIGTARVMLAGLNATVEDPELLARVHYLLGRLQFELFVDTPEVEYYSQSLAYLRQSLAEDPGGPLARRLLDFLLSLPQTATAPQSAEGRPETPSEGEGAAISAEKRIF